MGVPIVKAIRGNGTFEGADLMWLRPDAAILGRGLRTNDEGAAQVAAILSEKETRGASINTKNV